MCKPPASVIISTPAHGLYVWIHHTNANQRAILGGSGEPGMPKAKFPERGFEHQQTRIAVKSCKKLVVQRLHACISRERQLIRVHSMAAWTETM